jgi:hypothetical protein
LSVADREVVHCSDVRLDTPDKQETSMTDKHAALRATVRTQRLPLGLIVLATLPGEEPKEYSFAGISSRDDFMRRVKINGGTCEIVETPDNSLP